MDFSDLGGGRPHDCLTAALHHLVLGTPDPQALARFYDRALGYRVEQVGDWLAARARNRRLAFVKGAAKSLHSAGYAVPNADELERLRQRIRRTGWAFADGATPFFSDAVSLRDPDGTQLTFGLPLAETDIVGATLQRSARLQHVVMASREPVAVIRFFIDVLGFTLSDDVVDNEGGLRTSFLRCSAEHHSFAVFKAPANRFDHHCYETVDWNAIRDWSDHFSAEHIRLQWGPGRHGPGNNLFVFIHDPDGNWVEVSAEIEIVRHDRAVGKWLHEERTLNYWGRGFLRS